MLQKLILPASLMVYESPGPKVTMSITFGAGASRFPNNDRTLMEEEE